MFPFLLLFSCSSEEADRVFAGDDEAFVRFMLLVDSNNDVVESPQVESSLQPVADYVKDDVRILKIPVALTASEVADNTAVTFSTSVTPALDVTVSPENTLTFSPSKLTDTISVRINSRWDPEQNPELIMQLTQASDRAIHLGMPGSAGRLAQLNVTFGYPDLRYTFASNRIEIAGAQDESILFTVNFPDGYFMEEINEDLLFESLNSFAYSLDRESATPSSITFRVTLLEDIQDDDVLYQSSLRLTSESGYEPAGSTTLQIVKPIKTIRENTVNTAANFYNLADPFNRTFGETWDGFDGDGICEWESFFAFSKPVVVPADHPDAVLFDDRGTGDPGDDIYHHAFQIGFRSNVLSLTTNSFNLKRLFSNESSSYANSPGFDVFPAIEFYPENGTSTQSGAVAIIPQFLTISGRNGNTHVFAISGTGTYAEYEDGKYELIFDIELSNDEVLGGTVIIPCRMYNTFNYPDPEPLLGTPCINEFTL